MEQAGYDFLTQQEGSRAKMYLCTAGKETIGVGHVILPSEKHLLTATLTKAQITELLQKDVQQRFGPGVTKALTRPATSNQLAAMISLCFNIGTAGFAGSTVARLHNSGTATPAQLTAAFGAWNKITNPKTGKKEVSPALTARRAREAKFYLS